MHVSATADYTRIVIMGAAGRDYWNFLMAYRDTPEYEVVAFTQTQIPGIEDRTFPAALAGDLYENGIPMHPESALPDIVEQYDVDRVVLAYSDLPFSSVMDRASWVLSLGCDFELLGPNSTMLASDTPLIAVCAVRTGCGKSQTTRYIVDALKAHGLRVVVIRHPMPYASNLESVAVQRFASTDDFMKYEMTIEEMEEYEQHVANDTVVYAGVDYTAILAEAEQEADVIVWDGGNNDMPFYEPDLHIVVADALRPGHEVSYYPGATNLRLADVVVINKTDAATTDGIEQVKRNTEECNPTATMVEATSPLRLSHDTDLTGQRVLVIEDGPTLTHGGMSYGAGYSAAHDRNATIVNPQLFAKGTVQETLDAYGLEHVVPAMGYTQEELSDLERTIIAAGCDYVVNASPVDLTRVLDIETPVITVSYSLSPDTQLKQTVASFVSTQC